MFLTTDRLGRLTRSRFAAPVAVALAILVLTINEIGYFSLNRSTATRDQALDARLIVEQLRRQVTVAESAQRGYLLTQRESYKPDFEKGVRDLKVGITQLEALATRNPVQRDSLLRLAKAVAEKIAELQDTIRMAEAGNRAGAVALVLSDIGREHWMAIDQLSD